ncbi:MAG: folate-binding protein [Betaproteobacteria bacterium]|nr:folate-binding protein [Betaproteobacteria bacterium]
MMTLTTGPAVDPVAIARTEVQQCSAAQPYQELAQSIGATIRSGLAGPELNPARLTPFPAGPSESATTPSGAAGLSEPFEGTGFFCALPDHAVMTVSGSDGISFLHAQLTNDLAALGEQQVQLNGYCTPKGRLLATAMTWRHADTVTLIIPSAHGRSLASRLRKYVMRAKVSIELAEDVAILGLAQSVDGDALGSLGVRVPAAMRTSPPGERLAVGLLPVQANDRVWTRQLLMVPAGQLKAVWQSLSTILHPASTASWRWLEVLSGVPRIVGGAVEQFVPQMINLERVEGVNFKKGCYPGQEVVARSQYLGKLKRRMFLGSIRAAEISPGQDVYADGQAEPAGQVVLAAPVPDWIAHGLAGSHPEAATGLADPVQVVLFEASREVVAQHLAKATLRMESPDGDPIHGIALPYDL